MSHNPVREGDIPPVKIYKDTLRIQLGRHRYPLIMCYICSVCEQPLLAYWKLNRKERVDRRIVGRALRDSGFGAYRFFEEENGQGFEYDPERDPKKRHFHQKQSEYSYSEDIVQSWMIFMQLNPIVTVNRLLQIMINKGEYETLVDREHRFLNTQDLALKFIESMRASMDFFLVIDDIAKHGKPIFYFEIIKWQNRVSGSYDEYSGVEQSVRIFGKKLLRDLDFGEHTIHIHEYYLGEEA